MTLNSSKTHLYYIDLLRVYLTILVFYHHSAISFGASGGWYYKVKELVSNNVEGLLSINMGIDQSYFMSLFFFISAFLMPASYDRKGTKKFINDRIKRLVIPLLIFFFIINPLLNYWIYDSKYEVGFGPMWFVLSLILFELAYVVYRTIDKRIYMPWSIPNITQTLFFIIFMGLWAFVARLFFPTDYNFIGLNLGYFPLYIGMYFLGIIAYRNNWLDQIKLKDGYKWLLAIIFIIMPLFLLSLKDCPNGSLISGGINKFARAYAFWEPAMCVAVCYFLLAFTQRYFNRKYVLVDWLSKQSYSFYIIHPVVLVGCTFLVEMIPVAPLLRFVILLCIGIPLCFIAGYLFKRFLGIFKINV